MTTPYKVGASGLTIPNPSRPLAAILLGLCGALLLLVGIAILACLTSASPWGVEHLLTWIAVAAALVHAGCLFFDGLRARLELQVPIPVPGNLGAAEKTLEQVLFHKAIPVSVREPGPFHLLVQTLWPHCRSLPPAPRSLVDGLPHRVWPLVPAIALLVIVLTNGGPALFPILILVMLLFALAVHVRAIAQLPANATRVETCEAKIGPITDVGHPDAMTHHNQAVIRLAEDSGYPNRMIRDVHEVIPQGGRNSFETHVLFETQPMPVAVATSAARSANVLQAAAALLCLLGWGSLLLVFCFRNSATIALVLLTGLLGVMLAEDLLRLARRLMCCFRFRSDVFWIRMHGTFTESTVAMHASQANTFSTAKEVAQSEIFLELRATRLISECSCIPVFVSASTGKATDGGVAGWRISATRVLQAPRYALEAHGRDDLFVARLRSLLEKICSYSDQGRRLAVPDLGQRDLRDLVEINFQMAHAQAPRLLPVPVLTQVPTPGGSFPQLPGPPFVASYDSGPPSTASPSPPPAVQRLPPPPANKPGGNGCPTCGSPSPGLPGKRYCIVCDRAF